MKNKLLDFDPHAVNIAKRQYFLEGDDDLLGMFTRVATWVAKPDDDPKATERYLDLMVSKKFCPGGRVLAGAATNHGNVLNCFVQDGSPEESGTTDYVLLLAKKLALVTKVGGGNGLNLDGIAPKRAYTEPVGQAYVTISREHADYDKVKSGTFLDQTLGQHVERGYNSLTWIEPDADHSGFKTVRVADSIDGIWDAAAEMARRTLANENVVVDLSDLRPEGSPVKGSGGNSSGPSSFSVEIFDNFQRWAQLGGAEFAGPVATLRYVYATTLRVVRQGGGRRGAGMATMSVTHPDVRDFITAKDLEREKAEGDISTFNISVLVTDAFMREAVAQKSGILQEIAEHAWQTGEPGIIYVDRINEYNPMREHLGDINATNPCLTGDTRILTASGPKSFKELADAGEDVLVYAFDRHSRQVRLSTMRNPRMTRESAPVIELEFDSGLTLRATENHNLFTVRGQKVQVKDIQVGDRLQAFTAPADATQFLNAAYQRQQGSQYGNHVVTRVTPAGTAAVYNGTVEATSTYLVVDPELGADGAYTGIVSANCGEIALFPGEPCDLGAINLAAYVKTRGKGVKGFDFKTFREDVRTAVRFLDNVLDVNQFALEQNKEMSHSLRRLGLGVMGLADALILMGLGYNSDTGRDAIDKIMTDLRETATNASRDLAVERGTFPLFGESSLETPRRNVAVLTVAPTGTTSMLMGVSSGIEPVFAPFIYRKIGTEHVKLIHPLFQELLNEHAPHADYSKDGEWDWDKVVDAVQDNHGSVQGLEFIPASVRDVMVCAHDVSPADHVKMQGTIQRAFDGGEMIANSLSKTINLPNSATVEDVFEAYTLAFEERCKGITVYRDGSRDMQVLSTSSKKAEKKPAAQPAPAPAAPRLADAGAYQRSSRMRGFTDQVKLMDANGTKRGFFVTVNQDESGAPREVFIISGKAGDEANADSEALGRVVSIALQYGVPAEALVKTLRGINGGMYGTYEGRLVGSKADLLAIALETSGVQNELQNGAACPDCGGPLRFEEGCQSCESCGYSKCG